MRVDLISFSSSWISHKSCRSLFYWVLFACVNAALAQDNHAHSSHVATPTLRATDGKNIHSHDSAADDLQNHQMVFFASTNTTILFLDWKTTSWQTLLVASVGVCLTSIAYEGLKVLMDHISSVSVTTRRESLHLTKPSSHAVSLHLMMTMLYVIRAIVGYGIMLVVMTFNVWLCLAVITGVGLGYVTFGWRRATQDIPEVERITGLAQKDLCH